MPGKYAENTTVSVDSSIAEIKGVLRRYKAEWWDFGEREGEAIIKFAMQGRTFKFHLVLPPRDDPAFTRTTRGRARVANAAEEAWEQSCRQMWRALLLVIKAKLEAVAAGISTVEAEFLAATLLPDGRTVSEWSQPQITVAYETGQMPSLLSAGSSLVNHKGE